MKKIILLTLLLVFASCASFKKSYQLSPVVYETRKVPFLVHKGQGQWKNYLIQNVKYRPIRSLLDQLQKDIPQKLKTRGEAHITVITPPEYWNGLKKHLSIDEINKLAKKEGIQSARFKARCVGVGEKVIDGKSEQTYFVVVDSPELLEIRRKIRDAFVKKGGNSNDFNPENYHPHITLGFTRRDLHENDGITKDTNSCRYGVRVSLGS